MTKFGLSLPALRACRWPAVRLPGMTTEAILGSLSGKPFSRRGFLALTGTALGASAATFAAPAAALGRFAMVGDSTRLAFLLGGQERWVIDPSGFAGNAQLRVQRGERRIRLAFRNARFPGTNLLADFVAELTPALFGWTMKLRMHAGQLESEVPFERWLMGELPARSNATGGLPLCSLTKDARLSIASPAHVEFFPNWVVRFEGAGAAQLVGLGETVLRSDCALVSLPGPEHSSFLANPEAQRSLIAIERGSHLWNLESMLRAPNCGEFIAEGSAFDRISIETGELHRGLLAEALGEGSRLSFAPARHFLADDGQTFRMPLHQPRYAVTWNGEGDESALLAEFSNEPVWLHADGCAVEVGGLPGGLPFELVHREGELKSFRCSPGVLRSAVPMPGAIVEPTPAAHGTSIELFANAVSEQPEAQTKPSAVIPPPKGGNLGLTDPFTTVIRPDDLLCLGFKFTNFTLTFGASPQLTRTNANLPAFITVIFQPQHIGEQALFQPQGQAFPSRSNPPETHPDPSNPDSLRNPPLGARIAGMNPMTAPAPEAVGQILGASRLVFLVPSGINQIPYTLQSLLDWSQFELWTVPLAQPAAISLYQTQPAPLPSTVNVTNSGVRKIAPLPALLPAAVPPRLVTVQSFPPNTPQFLADYPTILEHVLRANPAALLSLPALAQSLARIKTTAGKPTPQTIQSSMQLAQQAFSSIPNLGSTLGGLLAIQQPGALTTSIEAPYRLMVSPSSLGAWAHKKTPPTGNGWTELWHTRLGVKNADGTVDESKADQRVLRAIWSPDWTAQYGPSNPGHDFSPSGIRMSLDRNDRCQLVELTSDWINLRSGGKYQTPEPVQVNRLMLSSLGAWLDSHGEWPQCDGLSLQEWTHRAAMGRDNYVRVVYRGYLFPFGHAASLVKVTERKFGRDPHGDMTAYLFQRMYVVVRQAQNTYPVNGQSFGGREFPFTSVQITTKSTPDLDDPTLPASAIFNYKQLAFWPYVAGQPFKFHMIAVDAEGQQVEFAAPAIFVDASAYSASNTTVLGAVAVTYNGQQNIGQGRSSAAIAGKKIAYAASNKPGDTSLTTTALTFGGATLDLAAVPGDQAPFYPIIFHADVSIPAISQLLGPGANGSATIVLDPTYVSQGIQGPSNHAEVFANLLNPVVMDFKGNNAGDKAGGMLTPNMTLTGLSREMGTVAGDLAKLKSGKFDPASVFADLANAQLLGGISLASIIPQMSPPDFSANSKVLKIKTLINYPPTGTNNSPNTLAPPQSIDTNIDWTPELQSFSLFTPSLAGQSGTLTVIARLHTDLATGGSTSRIEGHLTNFTLDFFSALIVGFSAFDFVSNSGEKLHVSPSLSTVSFAGALSFVNALQSLLQQAGSNLGGLTIDVQPSGVTVSDSVALPDIAVGVMSLQNLALGAELVIPFTGDPATITFLFCSKAKPFILSYCGFAGGGFFAVTASLAGIKSVEIELWFGGSLAINLGVASGGVHIMAGIDIIFDLQTGFSASAFIQLGGSLCVLGLITISIEFDLVLTYAEQYQGMKDVLVGQCTLTVQVDVALFSKSVDLTVERVITSGGGLQSGNLDPLDWPQTAWGGGLEQVRKISKPLNSSIANQTTPRFTDLMDEPTWAQVYLTAFAA